MFFGEATALEACEKLVDLHAWPSRKVDPYGWLRNFTPDERPYAAHMLGRFIFLSTDIVDALFSAAFHSLSNRTRNGWCNRHEANREWNGFLNAAYITIVQGEEPNLADSGFLFARKARQILGIPEEQLLHPEQVVSAVVSGFTGPIIFVDDFVGSGEQFITTWTRKFDVPGHGRVSFADIQSQSSMIAYCNSLVTQRGKDRIQKECPRVILATGNIIPETYSWVSEDSVLWPEEHRLRGIEVVRSASARFGVGDDGGGEEDWRGFHKLGLGLSLEHSTPDSTLPLFHWTKGWTPLVRRS